MDGCFLHLSWSSQFLGQLLCRGVLCMITSIWSILSMYINFLFLFLWFTMIRQDPYDSSVFHNLTHTDPQEKQLNRKFLGKNGMIW
jgi:hypothetical protein